MKKFISFVAIFGCLLQCKVMGQSQTMVFENFDGVSTSFVSNSVGFAAWKVHDGHYVSYPNAYRGQMPLMQGDVVTLESSDYDLSAFSSAFLRFSHICKVDSRDTVEIEYAVKMGVAFSSWQVLPRSAYLGSAANYINHGFSAASYNAWDAANLTAQPTQQWWRDELFDLSLLLGAEVKIRFVLKKGSTPGTAVSYGWLIDNLEITASNGTIAFPTAEFVTPLVEGTVYGTGTFDIMARVVSNSSSALQSPYLHYTFVQNNSIVRMDSVQMTGSGFGFWTATLPQQPLGTRVYYSVKGTDMLGNSTRIYSEYIVAKNDAFGDHSAAIIAMESPVQQAAISASPIRVRIQNKGEQNLDTLTVYWQLNSQPPTAVVYTRGLWWDYTDTLTLGTYTPTANAYDTLTVWVANPNNMPDPVTSDDTLKMVLWGCSGALAGNIVVGTTTYPTLSHAIDALRRCGVSNDVHLQLQDGIYTESIDLTEMESLLGNYSLRISSLLSDRANVTIQPPSGNGFTLGKSNNISIENITIDAAAYGVHAVEITDRCKNITLSNNILLRGIHKDVNTGSLENMSIAGNTINGGDYGIILHSGNTDGEGKNIRIQNNTLNNPSDIGIYLAYGEICVTSNTLTNSTSSSWNGMTVEYCHGTISDNKIHQLNSNAMLVHGLRVSNLNYRNTLEKGLISNNEIILSAAGDKAGIQLSANVNAVVLHNSVLVENAGSGIAIFDNANITASVQNNLLTGQTPIYLSGLSDVNQWDINYNNYYSANGNIGFAGGAISNLSAWKSAVPSDEFSTNIAPNFIDSTLHLQLNDYIGLECPLSRLAVADIDGLQRTPTTTMGCYAGALHTQNAALTTFINWGNNNLQGTKDSVKVVLVNGGSNSLTNPVIAWQFNQSMPVQATHLQTLNRGDSAVILLGEITYAAGNNELTAYIVNSGDAYTDDDTLSQTLYICDSLFHGDYIVGTSAGSQFNTLTEALERIYFCGIDGAVTLKLQNGIYSESIYLTAPIPGASQANTLTITSESGNKQAVTIKPAADAGVVLGNIRHIVLDGITIDAASPSHYGMQFVASCDTIEIKNCIIKANATATTAETGFAAIYKGEGTGTANHIRIAHNVLDGGFNGFAFYGSPTEARYGTDILFEYNEVKNQYNTAVFAHYADFTNLSGNRIQGRTPSAAAWTGIDLQHSNGLIANNEIRHNATGASIGIGINVRVNAQIIHNSVYMGGTANARAIQLEDADNQLFVQNNNLIANGSGSYPIYIAGTTYLTQWNIDYNNLFAPSYVGYAGGNVSNLNDWKSIVLSDLHSVSVQPLFADITNNMELLSSKNLLCPLLTGIVSRDILDTMRTSPTTMGAYHRKQAMLNAAPVAVLSPQEFYSAGDSLSIQFENRGANTLTSLTIYWSVNGGTVNSETWTGSLASGLTSLPVVLTNNFPLTDLFSEIVVWTANPNNLPDDEPFDDTIKTRTIVCGGGISGQFTVGQTGNFPDLEKAVAALEHCGINGAVEFSIQAGTYTMPILGKIQGASSANTITFQSANGNANSVTVQGITFDTVSDIVLKDLRIQVPSGVAVAFTAPASNVEIRRCSISTNTAAGSYGIWKGENTGRAEHIRMSNNNITGGYVGIEFYGDSDTSHYGANILIDSNTITNPYYSGLHLVYADSSRISGNGISFSASSNNNFVAMEINEVNGQINGNRIWQTQSLPTPYGIRLSNVNIRRTSATGIVSNNEIRLTANALSLSNGITVNETVNAAIIHNSVYLNYGKAMYIAAATESNLTVKNNIFHVTETGSGQTSASIYTPIYMTTVSPLWNIDFNNYYNPSNVGYFAGTARTTLPAWTAVVNSDVHSVRQEPAYTNLNNNLALSDYSAVTCPALSNAPADIVGNPRIVLTSMGCYAMIPLTVNAQLTTLIGWNPTNGGSDTVKVVLGNGGTTTLTQVDLYYAANGLAPSHYPWYGNLAFGDSDTLTLQNVTYLSGLNTFKVWIDATLNSNTTAVTDQFAADDTISVSKTVSSCIPPLDGSVVVIVDKNKGAGWHFETIGDAVTHIKTCGLSGAVTVAIKDGLYQENVSITGPILGSSAANTITFTSFSNDTAAVTVQRIGAVNADNAPFRLNGINHVIFSKLTLDGRVAGGGTYSYSKGIILEAGTGNIEIGDCRFIISHAGAGGTGAVSNENYSAIWRSNGSAVGAISNIYIHDNLFEGGGSGVYLRSPSGSISQNIRVENNSFLNMDWRPLGFEYTENINIKNNTILQRSTTTTAMEAIYIYIAYGNVINNKIKMYNMNRGIYLYNTLSNINNPCMVVNNEIIGEATGTATTSRPGIFINTAATANRTTYAKVYHNSVYLSGTGRKYGIDLPMYANNFSKTIDVQNNNFVLANDGNTSYPISLGYTTAAALANFNINNNNYFAFGSNIVGYAGSARASLSAWTSVVTYDVNSVNENPTFVNPSINLACFPNSNTHCPLLATVPEALADINGVMRNSPAEMGAYQTKPILDVFPYRIISPSAVSIVGTPTDISISIQNGSSTALTSADIYWEVNSVSGMYNWTGNLASGAISDTIFLGTFSPLPSDSNYITIITSQPNGMTDDEPSNDTLRGTTFGCISVMHGNYVVGTASGADFPDIATAVKTLYGCGVDAPVTIAIQGDTLYESVILNGLIPGASDVNTVTFTSVSGDTAVVRREKIEYSQNISPFTLNNVSHINITNLHIDGGLDTLPILGALTPLPNGTMQYATAIVMEGECENIEISHCKIMSPNTSGVQNALFLGTNLQYGIHQANTVGNKITNLRITDNLFEGGMYNVYLNAPSTRNQDIVIENNIFQSADFYGVYINYAYNISVNNNYITQLNRGSASAAYQAIYCMYAEGTISANRIRAAKLSRGIYISAINSGELVAANNEVIGEDCASASATGIYASPSSGGAISVLHNSILLKAGATAGRGIELNYTTSTFDCTVKNNHIATLHNASYPIYLSSGALGAEIDYNNYYAPVNVGYSPSTAKTNLNDWRTIFTNGNDAHSNNAAPVYLDTLSLQLADANGIACPALPLVETDINGTQRSMITYMGAYNPIVNFDVELIRIELPTGLVTGDPYLPRVHFQNLGLDTVRKLEISWTLNGLPQAAVIPWTGGIAQYEYAYMDLTTVPSAIKGENTIVATITAVNDSTDANPLNDIVSLTFYICDTLIEKNNLIGTGETFETVAAVIEKIKDCGIGEDVYLRLKSGTYSGNWGLTDLFPYGNPYNIIITADSGANVIINSAIAIQNTSSVVIEDITINANIQLDGCSDIVINNCRISGTIQKQATAGDINNIRITNNTLNGVNLTAASNLDNRNIVVDSNIFTNTSGTAINAEHIDFGSISYNNITRSSGNAMYIRSCEGSIIGNKIRIQTNTTSAIHAINIGLHNFSNPATGRLIANNEIIVIAPTPNTGSLLTAGHDGIFIFSSCNIDIVHNSILMQETGVGGGISSGICFNESTVPVNVFSNNIVLTSTMLAYPIYIRADGIPGVNMALLTFNYNNYYAPLYVGFAQGFSAPNLAAWKSAVAGDANSVSIDPLFASSPQDLNVHESAFAVLQCPRNPNVLQDIHGENRSSFTMMGAYNGIQLFVGYDLELKEIVEPSNATTICSPNEVSVKYAVRNVGTLDYNFATHPLSLYFQMDAELPFDTLLVINTGTLARLQTDTFELKSNLNVSFAGDYAIEAWISTAVDTVYGNDTLRTIYNSGKIKLPYENDFTSNPFKNLTVKNLTSDGFVWDTVSTSLGIQAVAGTKTLAFEAPAGTVTQLITNQIELTRTVRPTLKFWYAHDNLNSDSYDQTVVKILFHGDENTAIVADYILRYDPTYTVPTWVEHTVDLSSYVDSSCVIVVFESYSFGREQYMDSMCIISNQNLALDTILLPDSFLGCDLNGEVKAVISNTINQIVELDVHPIDIRVQIRGDLVKDTLITLNTGVIEPLESDTILLYPYFDFAAGTYTITAFLETGTLVDLNPADDTTRRTLTIHPDVKITTVKMTQLGDCFPFGTDIYPEVLIENVGNVDLPDLPIKVSIVFENNIYTMYDTLWGVLPAGAAVIHSFSEFYSLLIGEEYYNVVSEIELACDVDIKSNLSNEIECVNLHELSVDSLIFTTPFDRVGEDIFLKVHLTNFDPYENFNNVTLTALIDDGNNITSLSETMGAILAQSDTVYTFTSPYTVADVDNYSIQVFVASVDNYAGNDTVTKIRQTNLEINNYSRTEFSIEQNTPNPAKDNTRITYLLPADGQVIFTVHTITGQTLYIEKQEAYAGKNSIEFNTANIANGIYYYSVEYNGERLVKKMTVRK